MNAFVRALLDRAQSEPTLVVAVVVAVVVQVAAAFHVVIDQAGLKEALEPLVVALLTRPLVVSAAKHRKLQDSVAAAPGDLS